VRRSRRRCCSSTPSGQARWRRPSRARSVCLPCVAFCYFPSSIDVVAACYFRYFRLLVAVAVCYFPLPIDVVAACYFRCFRLLVAVAVCCLRLLLGADLRVAQTLVNTPSPPPLALGEGGSCTLAMLLSVTFLYCGLSVLTCRLSRARAAAASAPRYVAFRYFPLL